MRHISILGAGAFGFAIAKLIGENHLQKKIILYDISRQSIEHIRKTRMHPFFHRGAKLPSNIRPTLSIRSAVQGAELLVLAIPTRFLRGAVRGFRPYLLKDVVLLNLAKGLEKGTNMRMSEIIGEELGKDYEYCVLSGGMIASEVTLKNPLCAELACRNRNTAKNVAHLLWSDYLRIETTDDVIGVSLAGAFKNVIAIGAGIFDGLGYGESSKSAYVSAAAREMKGLAEAMGAKKATFNPGGQAWFGDLMTTCFGASRNRELGELIGSGVTPRDALARMQKEKKSVEGYLTASVARELVRKHGVDAPLVLQLYQVLHERKSPMQFITGFIKS